MCHRLRRLSTAGRIPKGFRNKAQGCEGRATLGKGGGCFTTPTGLRGCGLVARAIAVSRNPFRVVIDRTHDPRVARSSQPWALLRNPFGIRCCKLLQNEFEPQSQSPPGSHKKQSAKWEQDTAISLALISPLDAGEKNRLKMFLFGSVLQRLPKWPQAGAPDPIEDRFRPVHHVLIFGLPKNDARSQRLQHIVV